MLYQNPILPGDHPDPGVCRVGTDYSMTNSSFSWFPGHPVSHSRDMGHWRKIGHALDRPKWAPDRERHEVFFNGAWAPTLRHHKGRLYCLTTNQGAGDDILVHSDDPAGPWGEPIELGHPGWDNSLFFDDGRKC